MDGRTSWNMKVMIPNVRRYAIICSFFGSTSAVVEGVDIGPFNCHGGL